MGVEAVVNGVGGGCPADNGRPKLVDVHNEPSDRQYTPIPTRMNPGVSMFLRCSGEFIHATCKLPALTPALPYAMFSPRKL
jgi:hypothetical protein